jgi:hypothetical protein
MKQILISGKRNMMVYNIFNICVAWESNIVNLFGTSKTLPHANKLLPDCTAKFMEAA